MSQYTTLPTQEAISKVLESLKKNNINAELVENGDAAKKRVLELIPEGAEVMTMTSVTLDTLGIAQVFNESGKYKAVKPMLYGMDSKLNAREKRALGAAADFAVGSVHAVTENGNVIIASNTGSQLPGYAYAAGKVVWVVGTHKIVKDLDEGMKRINEHTLPLESERARKAYGSDGSNVSKVLIVNKEVAADRITLILVPEVLGF